MWVVEYIADLFRPLECFHASEIPFVFHIDVVLWGKGEEPLSKQFVRYWTQVGGWVAVIGLVGWGGSLREKEEEDLHTSICRLLLLLLFFHVQFAKYGNPNGNGTSSDPVWSPYGSAAQDNVAVFNITAAGEVDIAMVQGVRAPFCAFWAWNDVPEWRVY